MAVCNLFKELTKETGNFLLFSQYSNDLTRCFVHHESYRVTPSKFITFNINYNHIFDDGVLPGDKGENIKDKWGEYSLNMVIPNYLQNYFENGCSYLSHYDGFTYDPTTSANLFWNAMFDAKLLNIKQYDADWGDRPSSARDPYDVIDEMCYVGNIDIHSYEEKDGVGYSEVYCYIPNEACDTLYQVYTKTSEATERKYIEYSSRRIEGTNKYDEGIDGLLDIRVPQPIKYYYNKKYVFNGSPDASVTDLEERDRYEYEVLYGGREKTAEKLFKFNTIVVLYNVETQNSDGSWNVVHEDIPMGMYITGLINEDGSVNNTVTKYDELSDAYNTGTSYGLRLCTRFMVTPNATSIATVTVDTSDQYAGFSIAMNKMAESQAKMDTLLENVVSGSQNIKDQLALFKNSRTNVPYPKQIGDTTYWYINGRNTGVAATIADVGEWKKTLEYLIKTTDVQKARIDILETEYTNLKEYVDSKICDCDPINKYDGELLQQLTVESMPAAIIKAFTPVDPISETPVLPQVNDLLVFADESQPESQFINIDVKTNSDGTHTYSITYQILMNVYTIQLIDFTSVINIEVVDLTYPDKITLVTEDI